MSRRVFKSRYSSCYTQVEPFIFTSSVLEFNGDVLGISISQIEKFKYPVSRGGRSFQILKIVPYIKDDVPYVRYTLSDQSEIFACCVFESNNNDLDISEDLLDASKYGRPSLQQVLQATFYNIDVSTLVDKNSVFTVKNGLRDYIYYTKCGFKIPFETWKTIMDRYATQ